MAVTSTYTSTLDILETLGTPAADAAATAPGVLHNAWDINEALSATTTPAATKTASFQKALSGGAATIDLTALTGTNSAAVDFTGLKVQHARFQNPSTNANNITVKFGAASAYLLLGAAWSVILAPGMEVLLRGNNATPIVSGSLKNIDLSGTASQALNVQLVAG